MTHIIKITKEDAENRLAQIECLWHLAGSLSRSVLADERRKLIKVLEEFKRTGADKQEGK